jgi:hypothetical protein
MANKTDTSEYSSTKAPDTRKEAEERQSTPDARLIPGGAHGSHTAQGMAGLDIKADPAASNSGQPPSNATDRSDTA